METTEKLIDVFKGFRMNPTSIDQFETVGKSILMSKMQNFIDKNQPIEFAMLGYPMKSGNSRDKVLGTLPDMAEEVSLNNFKSFNERIKQHYAPGVRIHIVDDGFIFNDLLDIHDNTVKQYQEATMDIGKDAPMDWHNLNDLYSGQSLQEKRDKLMTHFGVDEVELEKRILFDPDVNMLYRGMIRFMEEELAIKNFPSRNQLNKAAKILTRKMMLRNEAYSNLVKTEFDDKIRLSMHQSVNNGNKYSFQLIPSSRAMYSPWHCALLIDNEGYVTIHKKDAEAAGYTLQYKDGRPYNYTN